MRMPEQEPNHSGSFPVIVSQARHRGFPKQCDDPIAGRFKCLLVTMKTSQVVVCPLRVLLLGLCCDESTRAVLVWPIKPAAQLALWLL